MWGGSLQLHVLATHCRKTPNLSTVRQSTETPGGKELFNHCKCTGNVSVHLPWGGHWVNALQTSSQYVPSKTPRVGSIPQPKPQGVALQIETHAAALVFTASLPCPLWMTAVACIQVSQRRSNEMHLTDSLPWTWSQGNGGGSG